MGSGPLGKDLYKVLPRNRRGVVRYMGIVGWHSFVGKGLLQQLKSLEPTL